MSPGGGRRGQDSGPTVVSCPCTETRHTARPPPFPGVRQPADEASFPRPPEVSASVSSLSVMCSLGVSLRLSCLPSTPPICRWESCYLGKFGEIFSGISLNIFQPTFLFPCAIFAIVLQDLGALLICFSNPLSHRQGRVICPPPLTSLTPSSASPVHGHAPTHGVIHS